MAEVSKIQIFRREDAKGLMESGVMAMGPMNDLQMAGLMKLVEAGYIHGDEVKVVTTLPGFSLIHAWLKKDYPLLLHSHDSDCLYYVIAGDLQMGSETLRPGDALFVPGGAVYQYRPGAHGVEVLEFRHASQFDFQNHTKNIAFYEKAAETVAANRDGWLTATRPSGRAFTGDDSAAVIDRLFDALARGDVQAARDCFAPDAVIWHSFDQVSLSLDEASRGWSALGESFEDLAFVDVERDPVAGGWVQRHRMVGRTRGGSRLAWPICIVVTLRDGLIARLDEYMDRAGHAVVPDAAESITA